jgi:transcriptional regulator with XRE-family HTH domain
MLNERLKNLRLAKGLTLQQVADVFNISPASVASWEKGKNQPDSRKLSQLADVLGTSVEFLINGSSDTSLSDHESQKERVPFIGWLELAEYPKHKLTSAMVHPLHTKLSKASFATRFPGSNDLNWTQGPIPAGSLIFVDPKKVLQSEGIALVKLPNKRFDLAKVQMQAKSSGFFLKLLGTGNTVHSDKEVTVIGSIVEWRISGTT